MTTPRRRASIVVLATLVVGCASVDPEATVAAECPDAAQFVHVSPFLEASCGTIDCHGAIARPLRIYGKVGLRLDSAAISGAGDTTRAEMAASMQSLCGLQPELTSRVVEGRAAPEDLLVVQKARAEVQHKGERLVRPGDDGDVCLTSWLAGHVDEAACARAVPLP